MSKLMTISRRRRREAGAGGTSCRCIAGILLVDGEILEEEHAVATEMLGEARRRLSEVGDKYDEAVELEVEDVDAVTLDAL